MLEPIPDLPEGVIGFEAVGQVHAVDYQTILAPAIDAAAAGGGIRLVYVLGDRYDGYSAGALWQDAKLGVGHLRAWQRMAVVSDLDWVHRLSSLFGWMLPGDFKQFPLAELPEAIAWASASDGPAT